MSDGDASRFFQAKSGVRQVCVLAPTIFNTCVDWVMGETVGKTNLGTSLEEAMITDLVLAYNIVIFTEMPEILVYTLETLSSKSKPLGLKLSWIKTKI